MAGGKKTREDLRGRWSDVFKTLGLVVVIYLTIRWILVEPYVIPSGSMKPTLLIQDYVMVKKWAYGLRVPFSETWLFGPRVPERGDIVVFRSKEDSYHFMVKRVIGLPGDKIRFDDKGRLVINDQPLQYGEEPASEEHQRLQETSGSRKYTVQMSKNRIQPEGEEWEVPPGEIFMMGDNRDHSMDSRFWGSLPIDKILGQVSLIWMSCEDSDKISSFLCPPESFRTDRIFKVVQ